MVKLKACEGEPTYTDQKGFSVSVREECTPPSPPPPSPLPSPPPSPRPRRRRPARRRRAPPPPSPGVATVGVARARRRRRRRRRTSRRATCASPRNTLQYSVITSGDAVICGHDNYKAVAVGGTLIDGSPNESGNIKGAWQSSFGALKEFRGELQLCDGPEVEREAAV